MEHHLRIGPTGQSWGVWRITETQAERLGVTRDAPGSFFQAKVGQSIWDAIRREAPSWFGPNGESQFHKVNLAPGQYYARIARPLDQHPEEAPGFSLTPHLEPNLVAMAGGQMTTLTRQLDRICQTVHPCDATFATYGHDIRNLLILACTEVEMHWRGVLVANGVAKDRFTTREYVLLLPAMKLDEYSVRFPSFPWLQPLSPFKGWGASGRPTKDLSWYDAYNAVKHDRENEFARATLQSAFEALSAGYIMLAAQFGAEVIQQRSEFQAMFQLAAAPAWTPADVYIVPFGTSPEKWESVSYPFLP